MTGAQPGPARLGALEQQVMDVIWTHGASSVREIIAELPSEPAYTTIATVLGNLERKQMVRPQRRRRSVLYRARHSREEHAAQLMNHALATSDDRAASMLHFVDGMSTEDAALLREYLSRRSEPPR